VVEQAEEKLFDLMIACVFAGLDSFFLFDAVQQMVKSEAIVCNGGAASFPGMYVSSHCWYFRYLVV